MRNSGRVFRAETLPAVGQAGLARRTADIEIRVGDDRDLVLVKALRFLFGVDSQAHRHVQELEHDIADQPDVDDVGQGADALRRRTGRASP